MTVLRAVGAGLTVLVMACGKDRPVSSAAVPVTVATAGIQSVPFELAAVGTVEPIQTVTIQPQVSGQLLRVNFREGDEVGRGQVLFEVDSRPFQAALQQAQAILARDRARAENAKQELDRSASLAAQQYITAQEYDQTRANAGAADATIAADEAAVEQAQLNLQYATIRAPIAGRTGSLMVRAGNLVRQSETVLVTINQIRPILIRFAVPASNLGMIQRYRSAHIPVVATATGGDAESEGYLSFVDNAVDSTTGTIMLKGEFQNQDGVLWPGGFVNVRIRLFVEDSVLVVPSAAVMGGQQGNYVFVVRDSTADMKAVTVERESGDLSVVKGEIAPGDRVVTDGQLLLRPGDGGHFDFRTDRLSPAAGERPAAGGLSHHFGGRFAPRGQRGNHGGVGRDAAGEAVLDHRRAGDDDLDQQPGQQLHHAAVRADP
jgi:multidrug efflux system membrane fusion protein